MRVNIVRTHTMRLIAGACAAAAVAVPLYASLSSTDVATDVTAGPACLAWFGNKEDGHCLGYSNGNPVGVGTPNVGSGGPCGGGIYTSPLLPGTTISQEIG